MRGVRLVLWSVLLAVVLVSAAGLVLARNGLSARAGLSHSEDRVLYELRKRAVAMAAGDRQNPQAGRWRDAMHHFAEECAICHGSAGRGDGLLGPLVYPPAPDLTLARTQSLADAELHHIISEGIRFTAMPGMAGHDTDEEIWQLVALVRELPSLSADQIREMTEPLREVTDPSDGGGDGHDHSHQQSKP